MYSLVIDEFGFILAEKTFKGYSGEQRMMKPDEYISLTEEETVSRRVLIDWIKTFKGIKKYRIRNLIVQIVIFGKLVANVL